VAERAERYYRTINAARIEYGIPKGFEIMDAVFADVAAERSRQDLKWGRTWGGWKDPNGLKLAVLLEEVGEVARALLEAPGVVSMPDSDQLRDELVQVAAVAVAWCEMLPRREKT